MPFCVNCGTELVSNAKFCQKCGFPTKKQMNESMRQQEFEGKVYKCPSCGETLKSFDVNCPSCGHELRERRVSSAIKEFTLKLEAIESKRGDEKSKGKFSSSGDKTRLSKTDEQKISLIKSFSVPNTKEDMLEFMILATSSMNMSIYDSYESAPSKGEQEMNEAWFAKVKQVYEKAKMSYSNDGVFIEIKSLYDHCNYEIEKNKKNGVKKTMITYGFIILITVILWGFVIILIVNKNAKEINRLENIVEEVQVALDNKEYKHALRIADSIDYQSDDIELERKWDIQREYWVDKVIEEAAENGIDLEYIPTPDIDNANDEPDDD